MSTTTPPAPRERPILFRDEMVRAILDGRKTQTRRLVRFPRDWTPWQVECATYDPSAFGGGTACLKARPDAETGSCVERLRAPWRVGDVLWVREAWASRQEGPFTFSVWYRSNGKPNVLGVRWRPSIHLPRRFARLFLRVTAVRAERVNAISEEDARAEGVLPRFEVDVATFVMGRPITSTHVIGFKHAWDSMHGAGAFASGAWVWAITFERMEAPR